MDTLDVVKKEEAKKRVFKGVHSYAIPGNALHSFKVLKTGEVMDVFTPQREDYL
ncbi:MAG: hypothetical protein Q4F83_04540 [Eubacteriales bacterium]|nr:hypothetical protein [Eubacteriales bacterium]